MTTKSKIEWTEQTWNPTTGCTKISPGCKHCYAEVMAGRLHAMGAPGYENGFKLAILPGTASPAHAAQEADRLLRQFDERPLSRGHSGPVSRPGVLGDPADAAAHLSNSDQARRALCRSISRIVVARRMCGSAYRSRIANTAYRVSITCARWMPTSGSCQSNRCWRTLAAMDLTGIHWVIVGGESGPKARPMKPEWVENVKHQADEAGAAFFFKQWGGWGADGVKRHKKVNGRIFRGRTWDGYPQAAHAAL
jgi:hypothetical protein